MCSFQKSRVLSTHTSRVTQLVCNFYLCGCLRVFLVKFPQTDFSLGLNLVLFLRAMAERKLSDEDSEWRSMLSGLGSSSPKPRVLLGGMFCSVEDAFENKTLNFESFSPSSGRRQVGNKRCSHNLSESSTYSSPSRTEESKSPGLHKQPVTHTTEDQQVCGMTQEVRPTFIKSFLLLLLGLDVAIQGGTKWFLSFDLIFNS